MMLIIQRASLCEEFARQYPVAAFLFAVTIIAFVAASIVLGMKVHRRKISAGREALIGKSGKSLSDFGADGEGKVFLMGEIWNAVSDEKILEGEKIFVTKVEELTLRVASRR